METTMTPLQIKRALEDAGYTQADIARKCEVSRTAVNLVINKKASSQNISRAIAKAIGRDVDDLCGTKSDTGPTRISS